MHDQIAIIKEARRRDKRLLRLHKNGLSVQQIANKEKISRQRASFLLKRAKQLSNAR